MGGVPSRSGGIFLKKSRSAYLRKGEAGKAEKLSAFVFGRGFASPRWVERRAITETSRAKNRGSALIQGIQGPMMSGEGSDIRGLPSERSRHCHRGDMSSGSRGRPKGWGGDTPNGPCPGACSISKKVGGFSRICCQ